MRSATTVAEDALSSVAVALYAKDMAHAIENGGLIVDGAEPMVQTRSNVTISGRNYVMTVTACLSPVREET